ncbi:MAG: addiction module protein, partial [Nitrococcus sp.]|nr:addiction module protein [Nitrococcus sp.]
VAAKPPASSSRVRSTDLLGAPTRAKLDRQLSIGILMPHVILDKLRAEALTLSESERAALAYDLVKSLDDPADADAASEWDNEISRRLHAIDSGTAKLIDRDELTRRFKERLGHR